MWRAFLIRFILMLVSQNWFMLWLRLELNTFTFASLLSFMKKIKKEYIILFFVSQVVSSLFFVTSVLVRENKIQLSIRLRVLLFLRIIFKIRAVPFHHWGVTARRFMPPLLLMVFLRAQKILPFYFIKSFFHHTFRALFLAFILSILWGASQNLKQNKIKLIIIFSRVRHLGWLLISRNNITTWELYFSYYSLVLFLLAPFCNTSHQLIKQKKPRFFWVLLLITLGGLPPLMGFFPKIFIFTLSLEKRIAFTVRTIVILSIIDLFIYSRLSFFRLLKQKITVKWHLLIKWNQKLFFLLTVGALLTLRL